MSTHEKDNFLQIYEWANDWQQLPWAHDEPTLYLSEISNLREPGTALDIGCGSGAATGPVSQAITSTTKSVLEVRLM